MEALSQGGDDYVVKPFSMKELLARIKCIQRRLNTFSHIVQTEDLYIDMNQYIVKKNNQIIEFSAIGYEILFHLISYQGTVVTRNGLAEFIENKTRNYIEDNTGTVHVKRIREKLGTYNGRSYIETIRGVGYRWRKE